MTHGGTNFDFSAGANSKGKGQYVADITSCDYGAPITEQVRPTEICHRMRKRMREAFPDEAFPDGPEPIPAMDMPPVEMTPWTSVRDNLPIKPLAMEQPKSFEKLGQFHQGMMVYRCKTDMFPPGTLDFGESGIIDFALVYLDRELIGPLDRSRAETTIELPQSPQTEPVIDVLDEGMGHFNFDRLMTPERKGVVGPVKLNGTELEDWEVYPLPLDDKKFLSPFKPGDTQRKTGRFFRGKLDLKTVADTVLDMSDSKKGMVWVNGKNLGRFWEIGPQKRLFCPATFLKKTGNQIVVMDLLKDGASSISGKKTLR